MALIKRHFLGFVMLLLTAGSLLMVQAWDQSLAHGDLSKQEIGNPPPQPLGGP